MTKDKILQKLLANKTQLTQKYRELHPEYKFLTREVYALVKRKLEKEKIDSFSIEKRTKTKKSFWEKVLRKKYHAPFKEMKDISAVRIICLFPREIKIVEKIIRKNFHIQEIKRKEEEITLNQFWYRSHHFKVSLTPEQLSFKKYSHLKNFQAEIQIRSVLMHAWAEMEHKINYKNEFKLSEKKQRKIARLSALLELSDELLDEI